LRPKMDESTRKIHVKPEIRILGVDDGPGTSPRVLLVGVVCRAGSVDGVMRTEITRDGTDVTEKLIEMIGRSRQRGQLRVVMTDGVTFAGFNILDVRRVSDELGLPVIVVSKTKPNMREIRQALKHLPDWRMRWEIIRGTGRIYGLRPRPRGPQIYIQPVGISLEAARRIVVISCLRSSIPEPLRLAHLIATAMVRGESRGGS